MTTAVERAADMLLTKRHKGFLKTTWRPLNTHEMTALDIQLQAALSIPEVRQDKELMTAFRKASGELQRYTLKPATTAGRNAEIIETEKNLFEAIARHTQKNVKPKSPK